MTHEEIIVALRAAQPVSPLRPGSPNRPSPPQRPRVMVDVAVLVEAADALESLVAEVDSLHRTVPDVEVLQEENAVLIEKLSVGQAQIRSEVEVVVEECLQGHLSRVAEAARQVAIREEAVARRERPGEQPSVPPTSVVMEASRRAEEEEAARSAATAIVDQYGP